MTHSLNPLKRDNEIGHGGSTVSNRGRKKLKVGYLSSEVNESVYCVWTLLWVGVKAP